MKFNIFRKNYKYQLENLLMELTTSIDYIERNIKNYLKLVNEFEPLDKEFSTNKEKLTDSYNRRNTHQETEQDSASLELLSAYDSLTTRMATVEESLFNKLERVNNILIQALEIRKKKLNDEDKRLITSILDLTTQKLKPLYQNSKLYKIFRPMITLSKLLEE